MSLLLLAVYRKYPSGGGGWQEEVDLLVLAPCIGCPEEGGYIDQKKYKTGRQLTLKAAIQ